MENKFKNPELRNKRISDKMKGKIAWNTGLKKGEHSSMEKMGFQKGNKVNLGRKHTIETRKKQSKNNARARLGVKVSDETKKKLRESSFNYVKKMRDILYPCIGHNEKKILDNLERELNIKIIRQYKVEGYFVDGYCEGLNIVFEVDEIPKIREKDVERQKIIENKLGCKFVRINDYD